MYTKNTHDAVASLRQGTPRKLVFSPPKAPLLAKARDTVPHRASGVDDGPIMKVVQAIEMMQGQTTTNSSVLTDSAITPRMNNDQGSIASPSAKAVRDAAKAAQKNPIALIRASHLTSKKGQVQIIRALLESQMRNTTQTDQEFQKQQSFPNLQVQKGDPGEDILQQTQEARKQHLFAASQEELIRAQQKTISQQELIRAQQKKIERLQTKLTELRVTISKDFSAIEDSLKISSQLVPKNPQAQKEEANYPQITDSQQTYEIECQRIIGKKNECWLKVMGLELKIILPDGHQFQTNQSPYKDFINKFSQEITEFLKNTGNEFLNKDTILPNFRDTILPLFRNNFNCQVLTESNFLKDNDISTPSKPINTESNFLKDNDISTPSKPINSESNLDNDISTPSKPINSDTDILTFCHVLRHQPALVHEPAAASRTNPDNRQPTPSPATTAMTNLLTKGLKLLRNSSKR